MRDLSDIGYLEAVKLAKRHYENFPVVSLIVPRNLRKHIAIVYWFARTADDYADEGNFSESERIEKLNAFENRLRNLLTGEPIDSLESALKKTIIDKKLQPENFFNLLRAFKQDVIKDRYKNFDEVLDYCSNSANPVGRILLELFDIRNEKAVLHSDKICTALQLTNFVQDTKIDYQKGRIYYPQDEMSKYGVNESVFEMNRNNLNLKKLIEFSVNRIQVLYNEGNGIREFLSGRFKLEITWTIKGGEEILNKIRGADFDIFNNRPTLSKKDFVKLLIKSLIKH